MSHNRRCEWSKTSPAKCRCDCAGRQHGTARVRAQLEIDQDQQAEEASP